MVEAARRRVSVTEAYDRRSNSRQINVLGRAPNKFLRHARKRAWVNYLQEIYRAGERNVYTVPCFARSTHHYQKKRAEWAALRMSMWEIVAERVRYGYKRIYVLLRRVGWMTNHQRIYRLYGVEELQLRT